MCLILVSKQAGIRCVRPSELGGNTLHVNQIIYKDFESRGKLIPESLSFTMQSVTMAVPIQYITYDTSPNCDILPPRGIDTSCKQAARKPSELLAQLFQI